MRCTYRKLCYLCQRNSVCHSERKSTENLFQGTCFEIIGKLNFLKLSDMVTFSTNISSKAKTSHIKLLKYNSTTSTSLKSPYLKKVRGMTLWIGTSTFKHRIWVAILTYLIFGIMKGLGAKFHGNWKKVFSFTPSLPWPLLYCL